MSRIPFLYFVFALVSISFDSVQSNSKKECDLKDPICTTKLAVNVYKLLIAGFEGLTEPLDPLYIKDLKGNIGTINYQVINGTLTGLKNCKVELLKFNRDNLTYVYQLFCPQLVFNHHYEVTGNMAGINLDGIGLSTVTAEDYLIMIKGEYERSIFEKDQKLHFIVKNYHIETELRGNLLFESKKIIKGDKAKVDSVLAYANSNKKIMEEHMRSPILEKYMTIFMKSIDTFLKAIPVDSIFSL